jgi:uncharacterized repeat protein (TIGR03803 family)
LGTIFKLDHAGHETLLYSFKGTPDGANPAAGVIMDEAGNLFGTTQYGGHITSPTGLGNGVVIKLDKANKETVLYRFRGSLDGANPNGVIRDLAGNLYGTTQYGGKDSGPGDLGFGVVFMLDTSNKETVLYHFRGAEDWANPFAGLIRDSAGNLYGTTASGGVTNSNCVLGCGLVFMLTPVITDLLTR